MTSLQEAADPAWTLIIPVKETHVAKTRLRAYPADVRALLAHAFALDTVTSCLASSYVARVVIVTNDGPLGAALAAIGADVVADLPDAGLNAAVRHGVQAVRDERPTAAVAALQADLPALRSAHLDAVFGAPGAGGGRWFVPDADGLGTTLLAAGGGSLFEPAFGATSRADHLAQGSSEIVLDGIDGLRRDVDTEHDLWAAVRLGVGAHTAEAIARSGIEPPRARPAMRMVQGTVLSSAADDSAGTLVTDGGELHRFAEPAVRAGGLRLLRPGQRVQARMADGITVDAVTLSTLPFDSPPDHDQE